MASSYQTPKLPSEIVLKCTNNILPWLDEELKLEFGQDSVSRTETIANRIGAIYGQHLPDQWRNIKSLYTIGENEINSHNKGVMDIKLQAKIGQGILRSCATARSGFIYRGMQHGLSAGDAITASRDSLNVYLEAVRTGKTNLPNQNIINEEDSVQSAVNRITKTTDSYGKQVNATMLSLTGLSITTLAYLREKTHRFAFPEPGLPAGIIKPWDQGPVR